MAGRVDSDATCCKQVKARPHEKSYKGHVVADRKATITGYQAAKVHVRIQAKVFF